MHHCPLLSSWDRDQENSAFVGRELFRQAYSTPPDLYRPSSEQAKRAGPNMTDEGLASFLIGSTQSGAGAHDWAWAAAPRPREWHADWGDRWTSRWHTPYR